MISKVLYSPDNLISWLYQSTNNTSAFPGYQSFLLYDCPIYLPFEIRHQRPLSFFLHFFITMDYILHLLMVPGRLRMLQYGKHSVERKECLFPFPDTAQKSWADTFSLSLLHTVLSKGGGVSNWKILFWSILLSENSGSLLLHEVDLPEHILLLREKRLLFGR